MVAFAQLDWIAFVGFFVIVFVPWFSIYGLALYSSWYKQLQANMMRRYNILGYVGYWAWMVFYFAIAVLVWLALFLFWRDVSAATQWQAGIIVFLVTLLLAKLYDPIMFGGPDRPPWYSTRVRLIWLAFHAGLILGGTVAVATLFGLAGKQIGWTSSSIVAFAFALAWVLCAALQFIWSIMAAYTWNQIPESQRMRAAEEMKYQDATVATSGGTMWQRWIAPFPVYPNGQAKMGGRDSTSII